MTKSVTHFGNKYKQIHIGSPGCEAATTVIVEAFHHSIDTLPVPSTVSGTSVPPRYPLARHAPLLALPTMLTRL